ncbi:MAG TPA: glycerol-3-phosphate dehydrogenase [Sphingomonas sp.]|jgi:glycerol-3-phosphate dehydrogenase|uniref:glycerol-3-phosphate dehydrogenase n=1 Tax=Sphingomonas sp. TaxID=28214 RepID=UPI002ED85C64
MADPNDPAGNGTALYDLLVVGGGINGTGIARDAAGRGLSVLLVEKDDLASHTSSASTKLIHGGLRYLEYYEFRLVRESLIERERLLALAPHIIWPLRFVLPQPPGARPGWLIRLGLFLYDHIGGRRTLPGSRGVALRSTPWGAGLRDTVTRGFVYSDCWVEDARLVALNAVDAAARGATVRTRTALTAARREGDRWIATLTGPNGTETVAARAIANAGGPWVDRVLGAVAGAQPERPPRLVKGSHIIVRRMFDGAHAYILQNADKRIVFAIPYERDFTLIGTTDVPWDHASGPPAISEDETRYLCDSVNGYFAQPITPGDVVHSYAGVRPLFDDGRDEAAAVTRDYVLRLGTEGGPQVLSIFGGKITTYRKLAEHALEKLAPFLPPMRPAWTDGVPLPGGDMPGGDFDAFLAAVQTRWPFLAPDLSQRLARAYGTRIAEVIGDATDMAGLGRHYGGGLTQAEVDYLIAREWARTAEDILWRRSKLGLHVGPDTAAALQDHMTATV